MNRRQLRGSPLSTDCKRAKTEMTNNGDTICGGIRSERVVFFSPEIVDECRACGAWHVNWKESSRNTHRGW